MEFLSLFLVGLSYGSTACMFSCMPFLSPLLLGQSRTPSQGFALVAWFSAGRVTSYMSAALLSYYAAATIKAVLDMHGVMSLLLGSVTVAVGTILLLRTFRNEEACCKSNAYAPKGYGGYFSIGFAMGFNPCLPIVSLLSVAAAASTPVHALGLGVSFGLGAVAVSLLVFGFVLASVASQLLLQFRRYRTAIERTAAGVLIAVGFAVTQGWLTL